MDSQNQCPKPLEKIIIFQKKQGIFSKISKNSTVKEVSDENEWKVFGEAVGDDVQINLLNLYAKLSEPSLKKTNEKDASRFILVPATTHDPLLQFFKRLLPSYFVKPFTDPIYGQLPYLLYRHYHIPKSQINTFLALYFDIDRDMTKAHLKEIAFLTHQVQKLHKIYRIQCIAESGSMASSFFLDQYLQENEP